MYVYVVDVELELLTLPHLKPVVNACDLEGLAVQAPHVTLVVLLLVVIIQCMEHRFTCFVDHYLSLVSVGHCIVCPSFVVLLLVVIIQCMEHRFTGFSTNHAVLTRKSKDWLNWNEGNVSEWSNMSTRRLSFHLVSL
jgi:hypothetical protein